MEYVLLAIVLIQFGVIGYMLYRYNKKPVDLTVEEKERQRQERFAKSFNKLMNYNEDIAVRGYRDEE